MVRLIPLDKTHFDELLQVGRHPEIWTYLPCNGSSTQELIAELQSALIRRLNCDQYPFTIIDTYRNKIIGSTRLFDIYPEHKKLEIGWTWTDPATWGKGHNTETKLLLLTYCFETLGLQRIQFKTRDANLRSRAAILKIGAKQEGILRKDRVGNDGITRDSFIFSIVDDEWPEIKQMLTRKVEESLNKA